MLSFEVRKTGGESEIRKVHRDVIHIGASTGNDLVVRARGVLGRHARISVAGEELRLEVLGSSPGADVTLNGSVVKTAALAAGDRINIGEATITLLNGPPPNPEPHLGASPAWARRVLPCPGGSRSGPSTRPAGPRRRWAVPLGSRRPRRPAPPPPLPTPNAPRSGPGPTPGPVSTRFSAGRSRSRRFSRTS